MKEEGFQPFDYSKVNFSRFQGGSSTSAQIENKGKLKVSSKSTNEGHPFQSFTHRPVGIPHILFGFHLMAKQDALKGGVVQR